MQEIERKFLVKSDNFKKLASEKTLFVQAYLNTDPERTIRIRISGDKAFMTIKGKSSENGLSRFEWETEIDLDEAKELLNLCEPGKIEKFRYLVSAGNHTYEVDEFLEDNKGLVLAEIELENEDDEFEKPEWLGEEVTGNLDYYNSNLIAKPYKNWN
ncbi:CYTH domain-containing protein [Christiangramia sp. SM2212]|uniref:CYTH domain-containing protein n=1 Tax=Christiangramia sediminicola TaxID=3073267 RepID=A0ABU1ESA5_9FLAO|nr:CYTH domain-containing protein [Christiangramia sp. SM2212]MDR5591271.1 CYTH domain-containing protein [Christiangramia sp. SM2212]